jgi:hypothetical protein
MTEIEELLVAGVIDKSPKAGIVILEKGVYDQALALLREEREWKKAEFHDWYNPQCYPEKDVVKLISDKFCPFCGKKIKEII